MTRDEAKAKLDALHGSGTLEEYLAFMRDHLDEMTAGERPLPVFSVDGELRTLVKRKDRPDLIGALLERTSDAFQLLHAAIDASRFGHAKSLQLLLAKLEDKSARDNINKDTILTVAVREQRVECVRVALEGGVDPNAGSPMDSGLAANLIGAREGNYPLVNAVRNRNAMLVELLLAAGADPNLVTATGRAVLDFAEELNETAVVELLRRAGARGADPVGLNMEQAATFGHVARVLQLLPAEGPQTALIHSAQSGKLAVVEAVLAADPSVAAATLSKALFYAAQNGHEAVVRRLLTAGADANEASGSGLTALYQAINRGHVGIARALIDHGAAVNGTSLEVPVLDGDGLQAMRNLMMGHSERKPEALLHLAVYRGHFELVDLLIKKGADVNFWVKEGGTPLKVARQVNASPAIIDALKQAGAKATKPRSPKPA